MSDGPGLRLFAREDRWCFAVRIQPGASRDQLAGTFGDALKVQISAPPLEGRANRRLLDFLAREMGLKRSQMEIVAGLHSRDKTVAVSGLSERALADRLRDLSSRSNRSKG